MGTGGPFPGGKARGRGVTLTTHPHVPPWRVAGQLYFYQCSQLQGIFLNAENNREDDNLTGKKTSRLVFEAKSLDYIFKIK
jgi:hypothetical protein